MSAGGRRPGRRTACGRVAGGWMGWLAAVLWLLLLLGACDRSPEPAPTRAQSASPSRAAPPEPKTAASSEAPRSRLRHPAAERIVAIGDVHGDLAATRAALRLAGAVNQQGDWVGGKLVVVQVGDQIDRGNDDRAILDWFEVLIAQARAAGGALHVLNGNHEVLNVMGDFRYVWKKTYADFAEFAPSGSLGAMLARYPAEQRGRAAAFLPGGVYARRLAQHSVVVIVGDTVFVHGGLLPSHVSYGLEQINEEISSWMWNASTRRPSTVTDERSPFWTRVYSDGDPGAGACGMLEETLAKLRAARMVVGHTVQEGGISSGCGERVWRIDVGLAEYYGNRLEVLELSGGRARTLRAPEP